MAMVLARGGGSGVLSALQGSSVWTVLRIALIAAVIGYVIVRRLRGEKLQERRLLVLPAVIAVIGLVDLLRSGGTVTPVDVLFLFVSAVLALGLGAARGATIEVFARDGHPWQRYRPLTVVFWVVLIAVRIGVGALAHSVGAASVAGTSSLLLMLGLSLLGEGALVAPKARALGLPFAPSAPRRTMR